MQLQLVQVLEFSFSESPLRLRLSSTNIFPSFDSEQIPGNMMGAAARRPKSSATTTTTIPWPRLFRGRDGTAQQPAAAYCVCGLLSPFLFFAHWIKLSHECDEDVI